MDKKTVVLLILVLSALLLGCSTELGHFEKNHDHDGDGFEDHSPEEHDENHEEETNTFKNKN